MATYKRFTHESRWFEEMFDSFAWLDNMGHQRVPVVEKHTSYILLYQVVHASNSRISILPRPSLPHARRIVLEDCFHQKTSPLSPPSKFRAKRVFEEKQGIEFFQNDPRHL